MSYSQVPSRYVGKANLRLGGELCADIFIQEQGARIITLENDLAGLPELQQQLARQADEIQQQKGTIEEFERRAQQARSDHEAAFKIKDDEISVKDKTISGQGRDLNLKDAKIRALQSRPNNQNEGEDQETTIKNLRKLVKDMELTAHRTNNTLQQTKDQKQKYRQEIERLRGEIRRLESNRITSSLPAVPHSELGHGKRRRDPENDRADLFPQYQPSHNGYHKRHRNY